MSVDILIGGKRLTDKIANYSVTEFATSLDPSDMSGGVGQITVTAEHQDATKFARRKDIVIEDASQGTTRGTVAATSSANEFTDTITADSRLIALTYTRTAVPFTGTLGDMLRYYFGLVGLTSDIQIESTVDARSASSPGWYGPVLDAIKRICSAHLIEVTLIDGNIVVRRVRQRTAVNKRDASVTVNVDDTNLAQAVEVFYLRTLGYFANTAVYPAGGWTENDRIISVDANVTDEIEIDLGVASGEVGMGASLQSLVQPVAVDFVDRGDMSASKYCVVGNDGKPIPASRWKAMGGDLTVAIGQDTRSLIVRVTGSSETHLAPFRIAASAGTSDHYSSLRVRGAGMVFNRQKLRLETGLSADLASQEVVQVESDFIVGLDAAWKAAFAALGSATGPDLSISVTTSGINRQNDTGLAIYPTIGDFNTLYAGKTIGQFNAERSGQTIRQFNTAMFDEVRLDFKNQAFGNIAGARMNHDGVWHRITEGTVTQLGITYTASRDTTIADWNKHYSGKTLAQFNALAAGKTLGDLALEPLLS